ncbi:uncharacterized protein C19orf44 homolog isoform X2 [Carcharodon carcharias]|nr:uncharacterized protein C19orf44 homolog isoform X2 [Carcharodon carcharias]XP_041060725.1 uncharacterized protein C19orf44 homolog isoform X2 [Carcharodon carcharias]
MFRKGGLRNSALARAQAQLSGQRIFGSFEDSGDELQEYMNTLYKKSNSLKINPFNLHEISDQSDISLEDIVDREWKGNRYSKTAATVKPAEGIRELPLTGNRFLKKPNKLAVSQSPTVSKSMLKKANEEDTRRPDAASAWVRSSSAVLARLTQIENKIVSRRLSAHTIDSDEDSHISDEKQLSPKSSSELSGKGSRFLKRMSDTATKQEHNVRTLKKEMGSSKRDQHNAYPRTPARVATIDSDEEEMRKILGGSLELADESELIKRSLVTPQHSFKLRKQSTLRNHPRGQLRMPSPPSVGSPLSQSPRMKFVKQLPSSPSERSEIKSLDELFAEPSVAEDVKSLDNESSNDFRLNILTLEDLVPSVEQKTTKEAPTLKNEESRPPDNQNTQSALHTSELRMANELVSPHTQPSTPSREKYESDLESDIMVENAVTGSEITEHLTGDSNVSKKEKNFPEKLHKRLKADGESTLCSEYSEDFENSDSEVSLAKMDQSESCADQSESSADRLSKEELKTDYSDYSTFHSTSSTPTSDQSNLAASSESSCSLRRKRESGLTKVIVKDTAIQTQPSGFTYTWPREGGVTVLGASLGAAYIDPTPIASHVISPEAMEALTAYNPASFALNDMLKQQLTLIRQFVQVSRHLYLSVVASIEQDNYHYTTLEETKEFIRSRRPPPISLDQALEEVHQELKEYHCI